MPTQKIRNYFHYVNVGNKDAIHRVSTRGDRFFDRISVLFTISILLGAMSATGYAYAFPGLRKYRTHQNACRDGDLSRLKNPTVLTPDLSRLYKG
ncbi:hypothetical protein I8752_33785 [Nostocaceae cyanobacterium CENA369]|uniref:Uncharacterized protein n=1 Tax=Dendronalium phyllosphericum CENA369 TaxID=1725256 RepID=A0A8J7I835_9NOST|nr:hypothetical protein [Dendronalium phyllosphericum]MBH8577846.1 hypothetical protein [Dendronalium phyllosphericum CENA369]